MYKRIVVCIMLTFKFCLNDNTLLSVNANCTSVCNVSAPVVKPKHNTSYYGDSQAWPRVVNGRPATLGQVPYQVGFKKAFRKGYYYTFCGGTILEPSKLLSAAHCFVKDMNKCQRLFFSTGVVGSKKLRKIYAVAGQLINKVRHDKKNPSTEGQWRRLEKVVYPKRYRFPKHDICLVFLKEPFVFDSNVGPIPYASKFVDYKGTCLASGFGKVSRKITSDHLNVAELTLIPRSTCTKLHRKNMDGFVCTSDQLTDVGQDPAPARI